MLVSIRPLSQWLHIWPYQYMLLFNGAYILSGIEFQNSQITNIFIIVFFRFPQESGYSLCNCSRSSYIMLAVELQKLMKAKNWKNCFFLVLEQEKTDILISFLHADKEEALETEDTGRTKGV